MTAAPKRLLETYTSIICLACLTCRMHHSGATPGCVQAVRPMRPMSVAVAVMLSCLGCVHCRFSALSGIFSGLMVHAVTTGRHRVSDSTLQLFAHLSCRPAGTHVSLVQCRRIRASWAGNTLRRTQVMDCVKRYGAAGGQNGFVIRI